MHSLTLKLIVPFLTCRLAFCYLMGPAYMDMHDKVLWYGRTLAV